MTIKMTMTNGKQTREMESKCIVAFSLDPDKGLHNTQPDAGAMMMGAGSPLHILSHMASCMGGLLTNMVEDPVDQHLFMILMIHKFMDTVQGRSGHIEVEHKEMTRLNQEG